VSVGMIYSPSTALERRISRLDNSANKSYLIKLISEIPDSIIPEIIDFVLFLKRKEEKQIYRDLLEASESSLKFWDNPIDDEVWNNV